jgi:methylated-DNA-protein-cysteine methyltransferase related protein
LSSPNFFEKVYEVTRLIPEGRVTSYGAIARYLGSPQSARMVGWALNSTKTLPTWVPAHRVVNRNGLLSGKLHFPGSETMRELLESEGVKVVNDRVENFEVLFWDPLKEIENNVFNIM